MPDIRSHGLPVLAVFLFELATANLMECKPGTYYCKTSNVCKTRLGCFLDEYKLALDCMGDKHLLRRLGIPKKDWIRFCNEFNARNRRTCDSDEKSCDHGTRCYRTAESCDGVEKCHDGFDERNCRKCLSGEQSCDWGKSCFSVEERCDGFKNCNDGSDERNCTDCHHQRDTSICTGGHNCTQRTKHSNCSTEGANDVIPLTDEERVVLMSVFTVCLLSITGCCFFCCCRSCCCCKDYVVAKPKPTLRCDTGYGIDQNNTETMQLGNLGASNRNAGPSPARPETTRSCSDVTAFQPTVVLLPRMAADRDTSGSAVARLLHVPPTRPHRPPGLLHHTDVDPELPTYDSLFPEKQ